MPRMPSMWPSPQRNVLSRLNAALHSGTQLAMQRDDLAGAVIGLDSA